MRKALGGLCFAAAAFAGAAAGLNFYSYVNTPRIQEVESLRKVGEYVEEYRYTGEERFVEYRGKMYGIMTPEDMLDHADYVLKDVDRVNGLKVRQISELEQKVDDAKERVGNSTNQVVYQPVMETVGNDLKNIKSKSEDNLIFGVITAGCCLVDIGLGVVNLKED